MAARLALTMLAWCCGLLAVLAYPMILIITVLSMIWDVLQPGASTYWTLMLAPFILIPAAMVLSSRAHQPLRGRPERCWNCSYELTGLPTSRCPECGSVTGS